MSRQRWDHYPADDRIYRVVYNSDDSVDTECLGMARADSDVQAHYENFDDLPEWMRHKLSSLSVIAPSEPGVTSHPVPGVGRRITHNSFWIFEGESDGGNA